MLFRSKRWPSLARMLLLAQCPAAISPLQPRDNGVDSGSPKTRHSASFESHVFVIGPNKAGTTSLDEHFGSLGLRSCHDTCPDKNGDKHARWDRTSHEQNASSPLWDLYDAFPTTATTLTTNGWTRPSLARASSSTPVRCSHGSSPRTTTFASTARCITARHRATPLRAKARCREGPHLC